MTNLVNFVACGKSINSIWANCPQCGARQNSHHNTQQTSAQGQFPSSYSGAYTSQESYKEFVGIAFKYSATAYLLAVILTVCIINVFVVAPLRDRVDGLESKINDLTNTVNHNASAANLNAQW